VLADEVFAWLSGQPAWQRDLARRLTTQVELDGDQILDALAMIKSVYGVATSRAASPPRPLQREDLGAGAAAGATRLLSLGSLEGVGLVSEHERIDFHETGMTVIYGPNAVGKSSYVRTLKKLCRTVDRDCRIRGSVYDPTSSGTPASVKVKISLIGDVLESRTALDETASVRLTGMSVFDAACAELYVDAQNVVQYIPTELRLLPRLAAVQDRLRRAIEEERTALLRTRPDLELYPPGTAVGRALSALNGHLSEANIKALATLTEQDRTRLLELRAVIAAAAASTAGADAMAAKRDAADADALTLALTDLDGHVTQQAAEQLRTAFARDAAAQEAVRLAADELTGSGEGVGSDAWQVLWRAARGFVEMTAGTFPPPAGQTCPLCLQALSAEAATRMMHFEEHVTSTTQSNADIRADELRQILARYGPQHAANAIATPLLVELGTREPALANEIRAGIEAIGEHMKAMAATPSTASAHTDDIAPTFARLSAWGAGRARHAATLAAAEDAATMPAMKGELAELEARERLEANIDAIVAWQTTLRDVGKLDSAHTALATNKITTAQRDLTETEVAKALDASLTEELKNLRCALPVQLRTQTAKAETTVALQLANNAVPISDIASEGERRALALGFFFAELAVANDGGGIVVDDPVSSLDDERRTYIADRLASEAVNRQVIVFTHDLPFLLDLQAQATDQAVPLTIRGMWRQDDTVGRVDEDPPFKAMKVKERIGKLKQRVAQWDADPTPSNQDEAWQRITAFYKDLRSSWERAVEERLFKGVVQRFQREVKTLSLKNVVVTQDLLTQVNDGMTRTSNYLHDDAPSGGTVPMPGRTQLAADLKLLEDFAALVSP
jgi:ABC-type cobalamin/Fe3+-siderophores transport system ATPase subunit